MFKAKFITEFDVKRPKTERFVLTNTPEYKPEFQPSRNNNASNTFQIVKMFIPIFLVWFEQVA